RLRRDVALKTIRPTHVDERSRRRFRREQTALARLHQTHIVPIYSAGGDGAIEYFVMPYIDGASLHDALEAARKSERAGGVDAGASLATLVRAARKGRVGIDARATSYSPAAPSIERHSHSPPARNASADSEVTVDPEVLGLGHRYWRSAAEAVAAAAEALEHA